MYISGHFEILNELLNHSELKNYFDNSGKFSKDNLFKGVEVVDLPCDTYSKNNSHIFAHPKICNKLQLLDLFNDDKSETTLWQRHNGYFAHLHSMTTDPDNNVEKIRNKIILAIIGYSLLALYDTNIFNKDPQKKPNSVWLGMVLHIITDSYSPAHTIRDKRVEYTVINKDIIYKNIENIKIHENIKSISKQKLLYASQDLFINKLLNISGDNNHQYIKSHKKQLYNSYKGFRFENDINIIVKPILKSMSTEINEKKTDNYGDIITFQYYDAQSDFIHTKLDFLINLKRDKRMYLRMMNECIEYLMLFKRVLDNGNTDEFIKSLTELLLNKTYHINKKYLKEKTNKVRYGKDINLLKDSIKYTTLSLI